jgi:hypothetical protein
VCRGCSGAGELAGLLVAPGGQCPPHFLWTPLSADYAVDKVTNTPCYAAWVVVRRLGCVIRGDVRPDRGDVRAAGSTQDDMEAAVKTARWTWMQKLPQGCSGHRPEK